MDYDLNVLCISEFEYDGYMNILHHIYKCVMMIALKISRDTDAVKFGFWKR